VAGNGEAALKAFSEKPYDLILMDCQMPGMDGYEATARIRKLEASEPGRNATPIVALTAHALQGDREKCIAAGMDDYLTKPFNLEQLSAALHRWLRPRGEPAGNGQRPEAGSSPAAAPPSLDRKSLETLRSLQHTGRPDLLERVIRIYLEDSLRLLEELREAVAQEGSIDQIVMRISEIQEQLASVRSNLAAELVAVVP
jgi:CheY-like chemotaxis protein